MLGSIQRVVNLEIAHSFGGSLKAPAPTLARRLERHHGHECGSGSLQMGKTQASSRCSAVPPSTCQQRAGARGGAGTQKGTILQLMCTISPHQLPLVEPRLPPAATPLAKGEGHLAAPQPATLSSGLSRSPVPVPESTAFTADLNRWLGVGSWWF